MSKKILVIDDDPGVRGAFQLVLSEQGFSVLTAMDGLQGIELAKAERPDLIFLDLKMPGIDGVETMRRLLAHDNTLNIYIVTAFAQEYMSELIQAQTEGLTFQLANKPLSGAQIRHIANSVRKISETDKDCQKIALTLYVVTANAEVQRMVNQLSSILSATYRAGFWSLDVVEVLDMPEKALEKDVFATPMLVREIPEPILKLLGDLSKMRSVLAAITAANGNGSGTVVL